MRVAVLGCGPAGLIAAHTAGLRGVTVDIYSEKVKSPIGGAQFLHEPIELVNNPGSPDFYIEFRKFGTGPDYAKKVYGDPEHPVSWDTYREGYVEAWSLRHTYDRLWEAWEHKIIDEQLTVDRIQELVESPYDLVISAIPAKALCYKEHEFRSQSIVLVQFKDQEKMMAEMSGRQIPDNFVIYNGIPDVPWYRASRIDEEQWLEFSTDSPDEFHDGAAKGFKPTWTDCDCFAGDVLKVGRFGKWHKGELVHHVVKDVNETIGALTMEGLAG